MTNGKKTGQEQPVPPVGGAGPAVPPPDNPLLRHDSDADAADREAARLRIEAIVQTRRMPDGNDEPPEDPGGS